MTLPTVHDNLWWQLRRVRRKARRHSKLSKLHLPLQWQLEDGRPAGQHLISQAREMMGWWRVKGACVG